MLSASAAIATAASTSKLSQRSTYSPPSQPSTSQQSTPTAYSSVLPPNPQRTSLDRDAPSPSLGLQPPARNFGGVANSVASSARNPGASAVSFAPRGSSLVAAGVSLAPGSFSSEMRGTSVGASSGFLGRGVGGPAGGIGAIPPRDGGSRAEMYSVSVDDDDSTEQRLTELRESLSREIKIKEGSENMLDALDTKKAKDQRSKVEVELYASNIKIRELRQKIYDAQQPRPKITPAPTTPTRHRNGIATEPQSYQSSGIIRSPQSMSRSGAGSELEEQTESPTFTLAELLLALESEGMMAEYYVSRANRLVDLFKRHPTLKYDLVWSVFGTRMQMLLLSDSREVVAAGYRVTRYAISDASSLGKIRGLNIDCRVIASLVKDRKDDVEREQALKFVRAFLDVKDGVKEISVAIVKTIIALAESDDLDRRNGPPSEADRLSDKLQAICIETLAELAIHDPALVTAAGGLAPLFAALHEGTYKAPESLTAAVLYLLDVPQKRQYLRAGYVLDGLFTVFTDPMLTTENLLKQNARAIACALKSWSGLMSLSMFDFRALKSIISSLVTPDLVIKETILDIVYSLLRIKPPSWASSFLAGRRLTTYGRVSNLSDSTTKPAAINDEDSGEQNFVEHYIALLLAVLIHAGLLKSLLAMSLSLEEAPTLKRKTTLLIGEVLRLTSRLLPPTWNSELQLLPELFAVGANFQGQDRFNSTGIIYQISSISRTLFRTAPSVLPSTEVALEDHKNIAPAGFDDTTFRQLLLETNVLNSGNHTKWNWDIMLKVIDGPLHNGKRLEEAIKASKFMKRLISFYRPFKMKFSELKNTRATQKFVNVGTALMHALLQTSEGVRFLADCKLLRQLAECLAQCDPSSGITASFPMFSRDRLVDTLCWGYFPMLGVLSGDLRGLALLDRWKMFNMMYHIIELKQRPDLIKLLLSNFDYSVAGHPRVLLSKAMTAGTKEIRIHATDVLRKYAIRPLTSLATQEAVADSKWAIQLLVTQLYDPEVETCATAVKILEQACNRKLFLEYIVECRPSLDHLGEIGAPLLLRFLSTSVGYHYLDGLDYISNEMDDWFLGRNDAYVSLIEASLARAFLDSHDDPHHHMSLAFGLHEAEADLFPESHVPPHFYRELTRTEEGCRLLNDKGHFEEFANTIREHGMQNDDAELMIKVKGCLWAVGNVGSMEMGAPFLESCDVVGQVVKIAEKHEVMSMRGTAFFVLGLISRSQHGLEILSEYGWDVNTSQTGNSLGFCIPMNLSQFLGTLEPWQPPPASDIQLPSTQHTALTPPPRIDSGRGPLEDDEAPLQMDDEEKVGTRVLELVVDLGNTILFKKSYAELRKIKLAKAKCLSSTALFKQVMAMLEWGHYRLPARKLVRDLFEPEVLRNFTFEEDVLTTSVVDEPRSGARARARSNPQNDGRRVAGNSAVSIVAHDLHESDGDPNSSEDEARTERQRSISDPLDFHPPPPPNPFLTPFGDDTVVYAR